MKKLLELKKLDKEVKELLLTVETPPGIYLCVHTHYNKPTISIYTNNDCTSCSTTYSTVHTGVVFHIDDVIDEQIAKDIIDQIEKVMQ